MEPGMKDMKTNGFPMIIIFVIVLMIVTVISWKSCSSEEHSTNNCQPVDASLVIILD